MDFCSVVDNSSRGKGRDRDLTILLSLLGVYANAEKVGLPHAPALKRAQRGDVVAAIAAKDAQATDAAANGANAAAKALCENATPQQHPKMQNARTSVETSRAGMESSISSAKDVTRKPLTQVGRRTVSPTTLK